MNKQKFQQSQSGGGLSTFIVLFVIGICLIGVVSISGSDVFHGKSNEAANNVTATHSSMEVAQTATPAAAYWEATRVVLQQTTMPLALVATAQANAAQSTQTAQDNAARNADIAREITQAEARRAEFDSWVWTIIMDTLAICTLITIAGLSTILLVKAARSAKHEIVQGRELLQLLNAQIADADSQIKVTIAKRTAAMWELQSKEKEGQRMARWLAQIDTDAQTTRKQLVDLNGELKIKQVEMQSVSDALKHKQIELQCVNDLIAKKRHELDEMWLTVLPSKLDTLRNGNGHVKPSEN